MYACYNVYRRAVSDYLQPDDEVTVKQIQLICVMLSGWIYIDYYMIQNKATVIQMICSTDSPFHSPLYN